MTTLTILAFIALGLCRECFHKGDSSMAGKTASRRKSITKKTSKAKANGAADDNGAPISFDAERLANVKEAEGMVEDSRLAHEEAKAKYGLSRAEHKLFTARRNRTIAKRG